MKYTLLILLEYLCAFAAGYQAADGDLLRAALIMAFGILTGWIVWLIFEMRRAPIESKYIDHISTEELERRWQEWAKRK